MAADPAAGYNAALRRRAAHLTIEVAQLWSAMHLADIDGAWAALVPALAAKVTAGQFFGASLAYAFLQHHQRAAGLTPRGPQIQPGAFTGFAASGAPLAEPLSLAPIRIKQAIGRGLVGPQALNAGLAHVDGVAESELQEAARGVMDVGLNTEPNYRGYLRHPNPGACGRCLILANKFYRSNDGFERHPACRCTHDPILVGQKFADLPDARERFDKLSTAEQDRAFGKPGADAIRAGSDPASVVNARAGMTKAGDSFTRQGTTKRSFSGRRLEANGQELVKRKGERYRSAGRRLSPAGCRKFSDGDPDRYRRLLFDNGYITGL